MCSAGNIIPEYAGMCKKNNWFVASIMPAPAKTASNIWPRPLHQQQPYQTRPPHPPTPIK
jgi:hypothetical protein